MHRLLAIAATALLVAGTRSQIVYQDLPLATTAARVLFVDVYLPQVEGADRACVLWLHGGGWVTGDRKLATADALRLVAEGYVVVAADYRYSSESLWPAQIHDAKGAVRWIRANARWLGIDPWRVIAFGPSAGGQLAAVLATSGGCALLEGETGGNLDQSSRVQGAIAFMAPHDLLTLDGYHDDPNSFESLLIGAPLGDVKRSLGQPVAAIYEWRARTASSVFWLDRSDPPIQFAHGIADVIYPWTQSQTAHTRVRQNGVASGLTLDENAGHALPANIWAGRLPWLAQIAGPSVARPFGRGTPIVDGDEPSIGIQSAGNDRWLTLDHAPQGGWAVAVFGPAVTDEAQPVGAAPARLLVAPTSGSAVQRVVSGQAQIAIPPHARPTTAQWIVTYQGIDGSIRYATSNAIAIR